jgi:hypothetical protein
MRVSKRKTPPRFTYKMVADGLTRQNYGPNSWAIIDQTTNMAVSYFRSRDTARSGSQRMNAEHMKMSGGSGMTLDKLTIDAAVHDALFSNGDIGDLKT